MTALFPTRLETDRLRFERLSTETVDPLEYYEICASDRGIEEVTGYTPWDPHGTPMETLDFLRSRDEAWEAERSADYLLRPKGTDGSSDGSVEETDGVDDGSAEGPIAGACGLALDWERRAGELGVWLRKRFWGRGYAGERADALLALAFDRLGLELVSVRVRADNDRSHRAVEKYVARHGGSRDGRFRIRWIDGVGEPVDVVRYTIERSAYEDADGTQTAIQIM